MVADASGDGVGQTAGQAVLVDRREGLLVPLLQTGQERGQLLVRPALLAQRRADRAPDVRPAQPHQVGAAELTGEAVAEDGAGGGRRQAPAVGEPRVLQGPRDGVEGQPVRHVRGAEGAAGDTVPDAVELVPLQDGRLARVVAVGGGGVGRVVVLVAHPLVREAAEGAPPGQDVLPQLLGRLGVGVAAGHPDDGDTRRCSGHATTASDPVAVPAVADGTTAARSRRRCLRWATHQPMPRRAHTAVVAKNSV
ncbi:hypothetical protein RKD49_006398 [Streptomyces glaucescens]